MLQTKFGRADAFDLEFDLEFEDLVKHLEAADDDLETPSQPLPRVLHDAPAPRPRRFWRWFRGGVDGPL